MRCPTSTSGLTRVRFAVSDQGSRRQPYCGGRPPRYLDLWNRVCLPVRCFGLLFWMPATSASAGRSAECFAGRCVCSSGGAGVGIVLLALLDDIDPAPHSSDSDSSRQPLQFPAELDHRHQLFCDSLWRFDSGAAVHHHSRCDRSPLAPLLFGFWLTLIFGLGGTTPLPRWLLGRAYEILTFERFTFWATLMAMPIVGLLAIELARPFPCESGCWLVAGCRRDYRRSVGLAYSQSLSSRRLR